MKPKRWRSWRVCPNCGSRATKIFNLSGTGSLQCQICNHKYDPPTPTTGLQVIEHARDALILLTNEAPAYYVGIHRYSFRAGMPLPITGAVSIDVNGQFRSCFRVIDPATMKLVTCQSKTHRTTKSLPMMM